MSDNTPPKCDTCQWCRETRTSMNRGPFVTLGECHRYPRVISVDASHFCGEHSKVITDQELSDRIARNIKAIEECFARAGFPVPPIGE